MQPNSLIIPALICYTVTGIAVVIEHRLCGHWPEIVRRGLGGVTVLVVTLIPALMGVICIWTWLFIALAFILAARQLGPGSAGAAYPLLGQVLVHQLSRCGLHREALRILDLTD